MMRTVCKIILLLVFSVGLGACSVLPQHVSLMPTVEVTESNEGRSATITVGVVDDRADSAIGKIKSASFSGQADITADRDLVTLIQDEIIKGLTKKGFNAVAGRHDETPVLKVEIKAMRYDVTQGVWASRMSAKGVLKAIATKGNTRHETSYRVDEDRKTGFAPSAEKNEALINLMISDALKVMLNDPQLMNFLSK